jgi:hypothetical protein
VTKDLTLQLEDAELALGYATTTQVQSAKVKPNLGDGKTRTYPTLHVKIGYADRNSASEYKRFIRGEAVHTITLDFSFNEPLYDGRVLVLEDDSAGSFVLNCYSYEEVVAEKFRAMLQQPVRGRKRQQDLYDVYRIIQNHVIDPVRTYEMLIKKSAGRDIDKYLHKGGLADRDVRDILIKMYPTLTAQVKHLPPFVDVYAVVNRLFESMPWEESEGSGPLI